MRIRQTIFQGSDLGDLEKVLINHGLIVLEAVLMVSLFTVLRKMKQIDGFYRLGDPKTSARLGIVAGVFIFLITIPVAQYFGMKYSPRFATTAAIEFESFLY